MDPATTRGVIREGIKGSTIDPATERIEIHQNSTASANEFLRSRFKQNPSSNLDHPCQLPQSSVYGLRHNVTPDNSNVNMPTAYERIQAYNPPVYVSPYGGPQSITPETDRANKQSIHQSHAPRQSSKEAPPWMCCFAQKQIPEWNRHTEIWNPGMETVCTAYACQHKKCEDCLWESLEDVPGPTQVRTQLPPGQIAIKGVGDDASKAAEEATDEGMILAQKSSVMAPRGMPVSRGINRDPKTGRPRLWTKNG